MNFKQLNILDSLLVPELCFLIVVTCASYNYYDSQMDTKNILFICGGAFVDLEKTISER